MISTSVRSSVRSSVRCSIDFTETLSSLEWFRPMLGKLTRLYRKYHTSDCYDQVVDHIYRRVCYILDVSHPWHRVALDMFEEDYNVNKTLFDPRAIYRLNALLTIASSAFDFDQVEWDDDIEAYRCYDDDGVCLILARDCIELQWYDQPKLSFDFTTVEYSWYE